MRNFIFILLITFTISCTSENSVLQDDAISVTRTVTGGIIRGEFLAEKNIHVYRGIPFASPPTGDLRWRAPQPVKNWEGEREAVAFGPSPVQAPPRPFMFWSSEFLIPETPISEDCLYLNVWTGAESKTEKRPVIVYIYGGGFQSGGSACPIYDGTAMAGKGVVFVSINYRVGKFGFFAHPELSEESTSGTSGNYAILDMIAGLEWVKANISEFGGDPDNVTIAGQSAGSFAVSYLTASPLASGLFHKAIGESGSAFRASALSPVMTAKEAEATGTGFMESMGASSLAELRAMPADSMLNNQGGMTGPYIDGYVIPRSVADIFTAGEQNDVPTLIGWNGNDILMGPPIAEEPYRKMISDRFGALSDAYYDAYSSDTPEEIQQAQFAMNRDEIFGYPVFLWGSSQQRTGRAPVYMYNFNRALPANSPETAFGAFHSGEIVYAYNNLHTLGRPWEPVDQEIADIMSDYWVNFAKSGDPNGPSVPLWRPFSVEQPYIQLIDTVTSSVLNPSAEKFTFWAQFHAGE